MFIQTFPSSGLHWLESREHQLHVNSQETYLSAWGPHCAPSVQLERRAQFLMIGPSMVWGLHLTGATTATAEWTATGISHTACSVCINHAATSVPRDYTGDSAFCCRDSAFLWWCDSISPLVTKLQHANKRFGLTKIALLLVLHFLLTVLFASGQSKLSKQANQALRLLQWRDHQTGYQVMTVLRKPTRSRICFVQTSLIPRGPNCGLIRSGILSRADNKQIMSRAWKRWEEGVSKPETKHRLVLQRR